MNFGLLARVLLPAILLTVSACAGLAVRGTVGGQTIDTRVDSEVARYYLSNYLAGKHNNPILDTRIDQVYQTMDGQVPGRTELKELSDEFSVDFAALYMADQIARVPINQKFRRDFEQAYEYTREAYPKDQVKLPDAAGNYEVLFVPTYLYKRIVFTGSDMAVPREALEKVGFPCYFVETQDDGTIEANAEIIIAAIRARAQSGRRMIIVSASKSSAEVALALTRMKPAETRHVAAWLNAVGALQGTPLIDEGVLTEIEWVVGKVNPEGVKSLTAARSRERFKSFHVPEHLLVVNYFGIPTLGSISFMARRGFFPLRKHGPNDGLILLPDMIFPGGVTLTRLGRDHIQVNVQLDITAVALAITMVNWAENEHPQDRLCPPDSVELIDGTKRAAECVTAGYTEPPSQ
jgi:hypothetical protein